MSNVLFTIGLAGCVSAPEPGSLEAIAQACAKKQSSVIWREWHDYEWSEYKTITYPNWRADHHQWAKTECRLGQRIASFHP